jgi:plastocyanin
MRLSQRLASPLVVFALVLAACGSTSPAAAPAATSAAPAAGAKAAVTIKGFAFSPAALEVAKGTVVTWTNNDGTTHTVTSGTNGSKDGKFNQEISGSAEGSVTFDTAGTFTYFCSIHSTMKGTVTVK